MTLPSGPRAPFSDVADPAFSLRSGVAGPQRHHRRPVCRLVGRLGAEQGGENHQRLRLLTPAFSRRLIDALKPRFLALAAELVDAFAESGRCE